MTNTIITNQDYTQYVSNLLQGRKSACTAYIRHLMDEHVDIEFIYEKLYKRSLYKIGDLWAQNKVSIATEHLATALTEYLMTLSYDQLFARPLNGLNAVVACVAEESHQLGAKMVADMLELQGWNTAFLGANTPLNDLTDFLKQGQVDLICLSVSIYFNIPHLLQTVNTIQSSFPDTPIFIGGQAFLHADTLPTECMQNVHLLNSLHELKAGQAALREQQQKGTLK